MTMSYVNRPTKRVPYYRCTSTFKKSWGSCSIKQVNADKMEAWVKDLIEELAASPALVDEAVTRANDARLTDAEPLREKELALRARLQEISTRLRNLVDVLARVGVAALETVKVEMEKAERDKVLVEAELAEVTEEIRLLTKTRVNEERVREVLDDFRLMYEVATGKERGELIRLLFRRIEYNGPNEMVEVELWDRTKRNLELEGSRFQTSWLPLHFSSMNRTSGFEEGFQSCYIIDLAEYRARRTSKRGEGSSRRRAAPTGPPHIVTLMNKALKWQSLLDDGEVPSRAELARREGITRARVTQIMKLLSLAPNIQEAILALPSGIPERLVTERRLRPLVEMGQSDQRAAFHALIGGLLRSANVAV
jgi:hypothetical protein